MTKEEPPIRAALVEMRQVLIEMVEYMPDRGGNQHKARWEQALMRAARHIDTISVKDASDAKTGT